MLSHSNALAGMLLDRCAILVCRCQTRGEEMMHHMPDKPVPLGCVTALLALVCLGFSGVSFFLWLKLPPEAIEESDSSIVEHLGTIAIVLLVLGLIATAVSVWHLKSYLGSDPSARSTSIEI